LRHRILKEDLLAASSAGQVPKKSRQECLLLARAARKANLEAKAKRLAEDISKGHPPLAPAQAWPTVNLEAAARRMLLCTARASASAVGAMCGVDRRTVAVLPVIAASLILEQEMAAFQSLLEHLAACVREGSLEGVLYTHKRMYDETPERFRVMSCLAEGPVTVDTNTAKVMACEQGFGMVLCHPRNGRYTHVYGRLGTRLRPMESQKAELLLSVIRDIGSVEHLVQQVLRVPMCGRCPTAC
jgi:hypothetical protein